MITKLFLIGDKAIIAELILAKYKPKWVYVYRYLHDDELVNEGFKQADTADIEHEFPHNFFTIEESVTYDYIMLKEDDELFDEDPEFDL